MMENKKYPVFRLRKHIDPDTNLMELKWCLNFKIIS